MSLLTAADISKTFDIGRGRRIHALHEVSIDVRRGECLAIIGESGSGKSTLGRIILGLINADSGKVGYAGIGELGTARNRHTRIQAVFQEPFESLNPRRRVLSIVREPLDVNRRDLSRDERNRKATQILDLVGLPEELHSRYPQALSGGQQQRVGIARALVLEPEMLILDEPTSSLDVSVRAQILDLLLKLKRERGISMLYISHDIGSVEAIADRVAVMYRGKVMEIGNATELLRSPHHPYTKVLLSARLIPDPDVPPAAMQIQGEIPSQTVIPPFCFFAGRCPDEIEACRSGPVPMVELGGGRQSRCIRCPALVLQDTNELSIDIRKGVVQ
jgi:oligopeptide/dipeptide ABC transporter ATP-binding protein